MTTSEERSGNLNNDDADRKKLQGLVSKASQAGGHVDGIERTVRGEVVRPLQKDIGEIAYAIGQLGADERMAYAKYKNDIDLEQLRLRRVEIEADAKRIEAKQSEGTNAQRRFYVIAGISALMILLLGAMTIVLLAREHYEVMKEIITHSAAVVAGLIAGAFGKEKLKGRE